MLKNNQQGYGWIAICLHWISAIAALGLFGVGFWMVDLDYYSNWYHTAPHYHQSVGLLLAVLTVVRLCWILTNPKPTPLSQSKWQQTAAQVAHWLLYGLLIALFVTGYLIVTLDGASIAVFNWFELPSLIAVEGQGKDLIGDLHQYGAYSLIAIVIVHVGAAVKHHVVDRDNTLKRMLKTPKTLNEDNS